MVQLKEYITGVAPQLIANFNSSMVQLKDGSTATTGKLFEFQFLYGTIKSV